MGEDHSGAPVELRRITPDGWPAWRDVRLRALTEAPYAFGSSLAYWAGDDLEERWRSRLRDVPLNVIAFADDDHGIGQVSCTALDQVGCAELISMWVDPSARGRGVGEALIAEVTNWAKAQDAAAVVLSVKVGNHAATDLYRRMSFVPTDDPADDGEVRMRLQLASRS